LRFVVLQVGVHHSDIRRAGSQNPLDARAREAAAADTANAPDAGIGLRKLARDLPGPIRRIVVDENDFPRDGGQRGIQLREKPGNIVTFFESRHHHAQLPRRSRPR